MSASGTATFDDKGLARHSLALDAEVKAVGASAVAWTAVLAGAAAAAALSLLLLMLGVGLGLSSVSPWVNEGASAAALGVGAIAWITLAQLLASGLGGYIAGRLRTRWTDVHADEVHFRDTAHGFLAWAIATLAAAALLTPTIDTIVGARARAGASVAASAPWTDLARDAERYITDSLLRPGTTATGMGDTPSDGRGAPPTVEVERIFANAFRAGALPSEDASYLGSLVAARSGLSAEDAQGRVAATFARFKQASTEAQASARSVTEVARRASAKSMLWLFVSLLIGAFVASLAATLGGRQRDA